MSEPMKLWGMPIIEDRSIPAAGATVGPPIVRDMRAEYIAHVATIPGLSDEERAALVKQANDAIRVGCSPSGIWWMMMPANYHTDPTIKKGQ